MRTKVLIAGAAGRDFHNFNVVYRGRDEYDVVGFTATQIPDIAGRVYPALLAGELYPDGIPIRPEAELEELVREHEVDEVVFAYSDVTHEHVMHIASRALAAGASFRLLSPHDTMIASSKPVAAICAVRTGSGKSQTTRRVAQLLREDGKRVAVLRHPMPYGDLTKQVVQRFERYEDLEAADCTIEEREEYEPHLAEGNLVFAGIDYAAILEAAEREADVIVWDGGNNDTPFIRPDVHIVVVDPHRPGHELRYHPGETNLRMANVCVVNKVDSATQEGIDAVLGSIRTHNPGRAGRPRRLPVPRRGRRLADRRQARARDRGRPDADARRDDLRSGGARREGERRRRADRPAASAPSARSPRPSRSTRTSVRSCPAMGYGQKQRDDLRETIERCDPDLVLIGTPIDLRSLIDFGRPALRITYRLQEVGEPTLADVLAQLRPDRRARSTRVTSRRRARRQRARRAGRRRSSSLRCERPAPRSRRSSARARSWSRTETGRRSGTSCCARSAPPTRCLRSRSTSRSRRRRPRSAR